VSDRDNSDDSGDEDHRLPEADVDLQNPIAWSAAASRAVSEFKFGDVITKEWLHLHLGVEMPDEGTATQLKKAQLDYFNALMSFRKVLLHEHRMALRSIRRGDYLIVLPDDQAEEAIDGFARGLSKELSKANAMIHYTRTDLLSHKGAMARVEAQTRLAAFMALAGQQLGRELPSPENPEGDDEPEDGKE